MPGLGRRHCDAHGLGITHFADDNNVRRLPQRGPKRRGKIRCVDTHLDLLDQAAKVDVLVLHRIFDGDDVPGFALVDQIDQSGQGRGLPRSCWTPNQHQPTGQTT